MAKTGVKLIAKQQKSISLIILFLRLMRPGFPLQEPR